MLEHTILPMRWLLVKALLAGLDNEQIWAMYGQGTLEQLTPTTLSTVDKLIAQLDVIRTGGFAYDIEGMRWVPVRLVYLLEFWNHSISSFSRDSTLSDIRTRSLLKMLCV